MLTWSSRFQCVLPICIGAGLTLIPTVAWPQFYERDPGFAPEFINERVVPEFLDLGDGSLWVDGVYFVNASKVEGILRFNFDGSMESPLQITDPDTGDRVFLYTAVATDQAAVIMRGSNRLLRVLPNGLIDPDYVSPKLHTGSLKGLYALSDGAVLVLGWKVFQLPDGSEVDRTKTRLHPDGRFDPDFPALTDDLHDVDASGRILGSIGRKVTRFLPDGQPDPSWTSIELAEEVLTLFAQPDGGVLVAIRGTIVRLDSLGKLDPSFSIQGLGTFESIYPGRLRTLPNGRILVLLGNRFDSHIWTDTELPRIFRLMPNGALDESFRAPDDVGGVGFWGDRVLVAYLADDAIPRFAGYLNEDGTLDSSWTPLFGRPSSVQLLRTDINGRILVTGTFDRVGTAERSGVARFLANGTLDESFVPPTAPYFQDLGRGGGAVYDKIRLGRDGSIFLGSRLEWCHACSGDQPVRWTRLTESGSFHPDTVPEFRYHFDASAAEDGTLYFSRAYTRSPDATDPPGTLWAYGRELVRRAPGSTVDEVLPNLFGEGRITQPSAYHVGRIHGAGFEILTDGRILVSDYLLKVPQSSGVVSADGTNLIPLPFIANTLRPNLPIYQTVSVRQLWRSYSSSRHTVQRATVDGVLDTGFAPAWTLGDLSFLTEDGRGGAIVRRKDPHSVSYEIVRLRGDGSLDPALRRDVLIYSDDTAAVAGDRSIFLDTREGLERYTLETFAEIVVSPQSQEAIAGRPVTLAAGVGLPGEVTWSWKHNGQVVAGETSPNLVLPHVSSHDSGNYRATAVVSGQTLVSDEVSVSVSPSNTQLANLSVRSSVSGGEAQQITGFVLAEPAQILVRAVGPSLADFDVEVPLSDPLLVLRENGLEFARNDDWGGTEVLEAAFVHLGAFALDPASRDAALFVDLPAGLFTVGVTGGDEGICLTEVYLDSSESTSPLVNLSIRARSGAGDDGVIAGFVVIGEGTQRMLIRAVGPGLASFGVSGAMPDPELSVNSGGHPVAADESTPADILAAEIEAGAFPSDLAAGDDAMVLYLEPESYYYGGGVYTAVVKGSPGIVLLEIYALPSN